MLTVLWYNGQIQHTAPLITTAYNNARLRNVTGDADATFSFDVTAPRPEKNETVVKLGVSSDEAEHIRSQNTYRVLLPKVLRSIFFPLVSSLMCSNFVLFPIAERALQVKHLHLLTGLSPALYWVLNFIFDFMFYMGTAVFVLMPLAFFEEGALSSTDISLIFVLNLLHGYAALPLIYLTSFLFDNPGFGFTALSILMFVVSSMGCLGEVFMEHYASEVDSAFLSAVVGTARQVVRLLPSCSYSRGMTKILQLASENYVCRVGGPELDSQCDSKVSESKLSLQQCCRYVTSPDRMEYVIYPFDVHPYSAFYEVVTLSVEGAVLLALLVLLEYHIAKIDQALSALEPEVYADNFVPFSLKPGTLPKITVSKSVKSGKDVDPDVVEEDRLVATLIKDQARFADPKLVAAGLPKEQAPVVDTKPVPADEQAPVARPRSTPGSLANTQLQVADAKAAVAGLVNAQAPLADATRMLIVQRLHKTYGYVEPNPVLQGLSFTVATGECFGLLGVNGVGKTTTFRILTGDILPHAGDAYIGACSLVKNTREFQRYIGYCPQKDGLLDMLTGEETLVLFARLKGIQITQQYLDTLLDIFRLEETAGQLVGTMSAGNRRKLSLCVSMIGMPPLLLLDEPYAGVGAISRRRIVSCMGELQRLAKISIVLTSHNLSDVEFLCNRIAILGEGKLQCLGSLSHLKEKFGKGYTILVKTLSDRKQDLSYQRDVSRAVNKSFPQAELVYTYEGMLEFRMSRVEIPWSEMFSRMARIKKRFKLQDFYISDTSLEQLFLSVTRKEASEAAAAAAAQQQQAPVVGHTMATTLGI
ncbi:LOW QUALITY PROTEIN: phospholipid-transporting ATPase ABCA3-like [Dermacentor silvarum]|uniref:LOW QUALITY PROTEIN: phospholipid-transporting ATPase ABCA3-like n=1 Tax=Dermacentor silvarum TaxID=543639 RepID=UPI002101AEC1|nr:LOW QUALITY PROTEIN: phospholipid-transporting ATPase ABCA3-like [Dermacentor silvarum]